MKKLKISLIINILIVILTVISSIIMFTGFKFMHDYSLVLETTKIGMFKFFTVDSNLLMGLVSLIFIIEEIKVLNGKEKEIKKIYYILKLMAATSVGLTFFVVFAYLGPITEYGIKSMITNSNLFFHLIIPVISILNFILFEKTDKLKFKDIKYGLVPTIIYSLFYLINVLIHMEGGKVSTEYDWYWFVQNGVWTSLIVVPLMFLITYLISLIIWKLNRK